MDQTVFQQKLKDLVILGNQNKKQLHHELIESFFQEDGLTPEQLHLVFEYLRSQGIHVDGIQTKVSENLLDGSTHAAPSAEPLSPEDQAILEHYQTQFASMTVPSAEILEETFHRARKNDSEANQLLTTWYLPTVVETACAISGGPSLPDKIQEGSLGLWMALEKGLPEQDPEAYLKQSINDAISSLLEEETRQKQEDGYLVERVRNLERKVKELTENEEVKYSIEELSAFLDMELEEIQDILKLTGDN